MDFLFRASGLRLLHTLDAEQMYLSKIPSCGHPVGGVADGGWCSVAW